MLESSANRHRGGVNIHSLIGLHEGDHVRFILHELPAKIGGELSDLFTLTIPVTRPHGCLRACGWGL